LSCYEKRVREVGSITKGQEETFDGDGHLITLMVVLPVYMTVIFCQNLHFNKCNMLCVSYTLIQLFKKKEKKEGEWKERRKEGRKGEMEGEERKEK
jgi:hypothetical protein